MSVIAAPRQALGKVKGGVATQVREHPKRSSLLAALAAAVIAGIQTYRKTRKSN